MRQLPAVTMTSSRTPRRDATYRQDACQSNLIAPRRIENNQYQAVAASRQLAVPPIHGREHRHYELAPDVLPGVRVPGPVLARSGQEPLIRSSNRLPSCPMWWTRRQPPTHRRCRSPNVPRPTSALNRTEHHPHEIPRRALTRDRRQTDRKCRIADSPRSVSGGHQPIRYGSREATDRFAASGRRSRPSFLGPASNGPRSRANSGREIPANLRKRW